MHAFRKSAFFGMPTHIKVDLVRELPCECVDVCEFENTRVPDGVCVCAVLARKVKEVVGTCEWPPVTQYLVLLTRGLHLCAHKHKRTPTLSQLYKTPQVPRMPKSKCFA